LNNRLVEAGSVRDVTLDTVHELNTRYDWKTASFPRRRSTTFGT
jgi:hypothetical protein